MTRGFHVYAKISLAASVTCLLGNAGVFALLAAGSPHFFPLASDNIFFTGFLSMAAVGLGIHTAIKARWPGDTVFDRAHKPGGADLALAGAAFLLTFVNASALGLHLWIAGGVMTGTR
jgi:hypothetical protein